VSEPPITVQAYHVSAGSNLPVTRVVIHDEEYPVSSRSAEDVAAYFATSAAAGSAHYVVDADSEQHCVRDNAIAWHAPPNQGSIGIEMDGYARFTTAEWMQPGSQGSLKTAARRTAELCRRFGIPFDWLSVNDLLAGRHGITSHANVSAAWHQSNHTDPGPQFPAAEFMALVRIAAGDPAPPTPLGVNVQNDRGYVASPTGGGWAYSTDGGVFTVGPAQFFGSMGGKRMNAPVAGMVPTPTGMGYALVGADGGMFNFGDANWQAYAPLTQEYGAGARHIIGADLLAGADPANRATWHAQLVSNLLETYVL
jgi:hypothetical protein